MIGAAASTLSTAGSKGVRYIVKERRCAASNERWIQLWSCIYVLLPSEQHLNVSISHHRRLACAHLEPAMSSIGPQIPTHLLTASANDNSDDDDDYTPALPPDLAAARAKAGPSLPQSKDTSGSPPHVLTASNTNKQRIHGPSLRGVGQSVTPRRLPSLSRPDSDSDSSDDSEVGPQPLPSSTRPQPEKTAVQEFIEREERRRKNIEEASRPKKLEREEWMIVPPKSGDLLGCE